ncbi:Glutamate 5-kinase, partial [Coemansia sp. RSA 1086]
MSSSSSRRRNNKRGSARRTVHGLALSNEPETFDASSPSHLQSPTSPLYKETTPGSSSQSKDSTQSSDEGLTIAPSAPLKLNRRHFKKAPFKGVRQNMQPPSASGMNTPEPRTTPESRASPALNPVSHLSQEVGTSSQLDLGAPRPGHGRTPSAGTPSSSTAALRRNHSSVLITNVDKHGGPRRRRSKASLRSKSRSQSQSRPVSPAESVSSELSSVGGKSLTIVLKLGTSSICDPVTHMPMLANLSMMVETICRLKAMGHRVVLVSSGAVGIGLRRLDMPEKPKELAVIQ